MIENRKAIRSMYKKTTIVNYEKCLKHTSNISNNTVKIELTKNNNPLLVFTQTLRKVLNSTGQNIDLVTLLASRHLDFTKSAITMWPVNAKTWFWHLPVANKSVEGKVAKALIQRGSWLTGSLPWAFFIVDRGFFFSALQREIRLKYDSVS